MGVEPVLTNALARRTLRRLELEAYASVVSAFRAQGPFTPEKKMHLELLCKHLGISSERHRAEVRRAVNDELLSSVAGCLSGTSTEIAWRKAGQKLASTNPRFVSRQVTHLPQALTSAIVSSSLGLPTTGERPEAKKNTSPQLQQALKLIISQNPLNAPKPSAGTGKTSQEPSATSSKGQAKPSSPAESTATTSKSIDASSSTEGGKDLTKTEGKPVSQAATPAPVRSHGDQHTGEVSSDTQQEAKSGNKVGSEVVKKEGETEVKVQTPEEGKPDEKEKPQMAEVGVDTAALETGRDGKEQPKEIKADIKLPLRDEKEEEPAKDRSVSPAIGERIPTTTSAAIKTAPSVASIAVGTSPISKVPAETSIVKAMLTTPISAAPRAVSPKAVSISSTTPNLPQVPVAVSTSTESTPPPSVPSTTTDIPVPVLTKATGTPAPLTRKRPLPPESLLPPAAKKPIPPQVFPPPSHPLPSTHIPIPPALTPIVPPTVAPTPPTSTAHAITPSQTPNKSRSPPPLVLASTILEATLTSPEATSTSPESTPTPDDQLEKEEPMDVVQTDQPLANRAQEPSSSITPVSTAPSNVAPVETVSVSTSPPPSVPQLSKGTVEPMDLADSALLSASTAESVSTPLISDVLPLVTAPTTGAATLAESPVTLQPVASTIHSIGQESLVTPSSPPPAPLPDDTDKFIQALCSETTMEESTLSALASQLGLDVLDPIDSTLLGISPDIMQLVEPSTPTLGDGGGGLPGPMGVVPLGPKAPVVTDARPISDISTVQTNMPPLGSETIPTPNHPPLPQQAPLSATPSSYYPDLPPLLQPDSFPTSLPLERPIASPAALLETTPLSSAIDSATPITQEGVLSELGLDESELLEGIPPELAETIQAIARLDEQSTSQMNSPFPMQ